MVIEHDEICRGSLAERADGFAERLGNQFLAPSQERRQSVLICGGSRVVRLERGRPRLFEHVSREAVRAEGDSLAEEVPRGRANAVVHVGPGIMDKPRASLLQGPVVIPGKMDAMGEDRLFSENPVT